VESAFFQNTVPVEFDPVDGPALDQPVEPDVTE
jgi:hypothetical protein